MSKKSIIGIVVAAVVVIAIGGFVWSRNGSSTNGGSGGSSSTSFNPANTMQKSFTAIIETSANPDADVTVKHDGKGNWSYTATTDGRQTEMVITGDAYYTKTSGTWYKIASAGTFNKDAYEVTGDELKNFQSVLKSQGTASCPSGTCYVWQAQNYQGNDQLTFYVDNKTNTITQMVSKTDKGSTTITYTYEPVTIEVPNNAQSIPGV